MLTPSFLAQSALTLTVPDFSVPTVSVPAERFASPSTAVQAEKKAVVTIGADAYTADAVKALTGFTIAESPVSGDKAVDAKPVPISRISVTSSVPATKKLPLPEALMLLTFAVPAMEPALSSPAAPVFVSSTVAASAVRHRTRGWC